LALLWKDQGWGAKPAQAMLEESKRDHVEGVVCASDFVISGIRTDGLFLPGTDPEATELLLDYLWRQRQASFLAGGVTILQSCPSLAEETGFGAAVEAYRATPVADRRAMMEHPCFRIWLGRMTRLPRLDRVGVEGQDTLRTLLADGARLVHAGRGPDFTLQRFDVDPLLAAIIPPSYSFDELDAKRERETANPYTLAFANEVVTAALQGINEVWPAARLDFDRFVKIVVQLPDLEPRSCSAARFAGAILLSSRDDTLLAVEESLIHECGHQVLYCVMELDSLIRDIEGKSFALPWSGSQRDAYGYFHATYIYLILALFFERVADSDRYDRQDALSRLEEILVGLQQALGDFVNANFFTETGRAFFERLARQAMTVIRRNRHRFAGSLENYHGPQ